jgi:L-fuconolactonase
MGWLKNRPQSWDVVRRDFTFGQLRGELDDAGVSELILVQACTHTEETRRLLKLASKEPSIRGVVGWVSLRSGQATEADLALFSEVGADKLVGVRNNHEWEPDGAILASPDVLDSVRLLAAHGLTLDFHFPDYRTLPLAIQIAERVPEGTYIVDHLGKPLIAAEETYAGWASSISALSELPNVFIKYSGWATFLGRASASDVRRHIDFVLETFGPDRVMFGSNWPVALVAAGYQETYRASLAAIAGLTQSDLRHVLRDTAAQCYLNSPTPG